MISHNIFDGVEVPGGEYKSPHQLMNLGRKILKLAGNERSRRKHGLTKETFQAADNETEFVSVTWDCRIGEYAVSFGLIDNTRIKNGLLLRGIGDTHEPGLKAVQIFAVNDQFPNRGLRRVLHEVQPADVVPDTVAAWEASIVPITLRPTASKVQVDDFARAISTVPNIDI